jgi:tRNA U34 5-methylaminomethyl-2-thiouridine-forming methyltransferase MnmC
MNPKARLVLTEDGSHTLYVEDMDEYYHSKYGAIQESKHIFIKHGWEAIERHDVSVLEVGFGTGLNALLTCLETTREQKTTHYDAIEWFPLDKTLIDKLNFTRVLQVKDHQLFQELHELPWDRDCKISPGFTLHKMLLDFTRCVPGKKYHLVYFDAFAPGKQPEMWEEKHFNRLYHAMERDGILVTYCARGEIKRRLKRTGFKVELLAGPPGKHQMIRAIRPS